MIDILNLAKQADIWQAQVPRPEPSFMASLTRFANLYREALLAELFEGNSDLLADKHDRSVAFAILRERERCARICESEYDNWDNERPLRICATAIREGSELKDANERNLRTLTDALAESRKECAELKHDLNQYLEIVDALTNTNSQPPTL